MEAALERIILWVWRILFHKHRYKVRVFAFIATNPAVTRDDQRIEATHAEVHSSFACRDCGNTFNQSHRTMTVLSSVSRNAVRVEIITNDVRSYMTSLRAKYRNSEFVTNFNEFIPGGNIPVTGPDEDHDPA